MNPTFLKFATLVSCVFYAALDSSWAKTSYESYPVPKKGGNFNEATGLTPSTFNPMLTTDMSSRAVGASLFMALFDTDGETDEFYPALASKVDISKDKKDYSYTLNPNAKWTDGTPATSDDIEYTFKQMMNPEVEAAQLRGYYEGIIFAKIDGLKFKFHVDQPRFNTLEWLNSFVPIQKKQFEKEANFNKSRENLRPVGTGAYVVKSFSRDQAVVLEHIPHWWASDLPQYKARNNFQTLTFKVIPDMALMYEKFIKGELDTMNFSSDQFVTQVNGKDAERFGKSPKDGKALWAGKLLTEVPMAWSGIALNLKNPMLSSLTTRKGLAYLVNYQMIIDKAYMGTADQSISPFGSFSENVDPSLKTQKNRYHFDPKKSSELFAQDGWRHAEGQSFLVKTIDGKEIPFRLALKYTASNPTVSKAVVMLKEIFKKSGVDLELKPGDATAVYKDFEDKNFEAMVMGWGGGGMNQDAKQLWSTESIAQGSNKVSYSNAKVDALITKSNLEFDRKKRTKMIQEIGRIIYEEVPYIFLVERHFLLTGMNSRIQSPKWVERYGASLAKDLFHE